MDLCILYVWLCQQIRVAHNYLPNTNTAPPLSAHVIGEGSSEAYSSSSGGQFWSRIIPFTSSQSSWRMTPCGRLVDPLTYYIDYG